MPQRGPKEPRLPKKEVDKRISPKTCPKCKGNHNEKDCSKLLPKEIEKEIPPLKDSTGVL